MNMYWVYELPSWLFGVLTIAATAAVGLSGLYATRRWVRRVHGDRHWHNEVVGYYLGAICVFYGITLGLLAVAAWQTYSDVETKVGEEAAAVRHAKPEDALLDDGASVCPSGPADLYAWRIR